MATMTTPEQTTASRIAGGSFLISDPTPVDCFFPEDFTDEQKQIAETTARKRIATTITTVFCVRCSRASSRAVSFSSSSSSLADGEGPRHF